MAFGSKFANDHKSNGRVLSQIKPFLELLGDGCCFVLDKTYLSKTHPSETTAFMQYLLSQAEF